MGLWQETLENRHQRWELKLGRNAVPMCETERKVSLDAPVRNDDSCLAEKIASLDLIVDLIKQHVRKGIHA